MTRPEASFTDRMRQAAWLWETEGFSGISQRLRLRAAERIAPPGTRPLVVSRDQFLRAAELADSGWVLPPPAPLAPGQPMTVGWVCVPPSQGSGGHTTMFRMVTALEALGHRCIIYVQDQHGWSVDQHRRTIRTHWPEVRADVRDFDAGVEDCHALVATGWGTAYAVLTSPARGARFYFVQDFEPAFSPAGSEYLLAEATYRFGFHGVTAGRWLSELLGRDYGMAADHFDFGCDLDAYGLDSSAISGERSGICYYCRPSTPRRAHELAVFALDLFSTRHPEVPIHVYGERVKGLPFTHEHHGLLRPADLNRLYNSCVAGLVLSATNVSLVPHEMLAAGCIPVVNDAEHNRVVLDNPYVAYAPPTPFDLAKELAELVDRTSSDRERLAKKAADSVARTGWSTAGAQVEQTIRRVVGEQQQGAAGVAVLVTDGVQSHATQRLVG